MKGLVPVDRTDLFGAFCAPAGPPLYLRAVLAPKSAPRKKTAAKPGPAPTG